MTFLTGILVGAAGMYALLALMAWLVNRYDRRTLP